VNFVLTPVTCSTQDHLFKKIKTSYVYKHCSISESKQKNFAILYILVHSVFVTMKLITKCLIQNGRKTLWFFSLKWMPMFSCKFFILLCFLNVVSI